ncbi:MAG: hypothetical protein HC847_10695 [Hydrococcus sp. RU_2_2]|nr:hypothetical protein [Hydrococcus sp. RU_2_2]
MQRAAIARATFTPLNPPPSASLGRREDRTPFLESDRGRLAIAHCNRERASKNLPQLADCYRCGNPTIMVEVKLKQLKLVERHGSNEFYLCCLFSTPVNPNFLKIPSPMNLSDLIEQALRNGYLTRGQRNEIMLQVPPNTVNSVEERIYLDLLLEALLTGEVVMLEKEKSVSQDLAV